MPGKWTGKRAQQKCSVCGGVGHKAPIHNERAAKLCVVDGCGRAVRSLGLCESHYGRQRTHGDPLAGQTYPGALMKWIKEHSTWNGDECLIWPYGDSGNGYGRIMVGRKASRAHRVMCEIKHGPAPHEGLEAAHSCGNGHIGCVNPNHLRWATRGENQSDKYLHKRMGIGRYASSSPQEG